MKKIIVAALTAFSITTATATPIDDIRMMTEQYPPYNYKVDAGILTGISVEVLDEVLSELNANKTTAQVELLPWARGYNDVQKKPKTMLFSMTHTEARDSLFKWSLPIVETNISLIALKSKKLKLKSDDDLKKLKFGVVRDDVGDQLLKEKGIPKENFQRTSDSSNVLKMLAKGRVDVFAYDENVAFWQLKKLREKTEKYEVVHVLKTGNLKFAFHKDTEQKVLDDFNAALAKVKASPRYQEILRKYK